MCWKCFQIRHRGKDALTIELPRSGVAYASDLDIAFAAHWWGHKQMDTFRALPEYEQAYLVAVYRAKNKIDGLVALEQAEKAKKQHRRGGR